MARAITLCVLTTTLFIGACSSTPKATPTTTTTTVVPVPTTLPVTTTTVVPAPEPTTPARRLRPAPTTTVPEPEVVPEPQVQGEVATTDGGSDIETWLAIGRCEQPGDGWGGINWSHQGPTYQGGLGMYYRTWQGYGGLALFGIENAGDATPMQQIEVARNVRAAHGYSAWGCGRKLGLR